MMISLAPDVIRCIYRHLAGFDSILSAEQHKNGSYICFASAKKCTHE